MRASLKGNSSTAASKVRDKEWSQQDEVASDLLLVVMSYWAKRIKTEKQVPLSFVQAEMRSIVERVEALIKSGYYEQISLLSSADGLVCVYDGNNFETGKEEKSEAKHCIERKVDIESRETIAIDGKEDADVRNIVFDEASDELNGFAIPAGSCYQKNNKQQNTVEEESPLSSHCNIPGIHMAECSSPSAVLPLPSFSPSMSPCTVPGYSSPLSTVPSATAAATASFSSPIGSGSRDPEQQQHLLQYSQPPVSAPIAVAVVDSSPSASLPASASAPSGQVSNCSSPVGVVLQQNPLSGAMPPVKSLLAANPMHVRRGSFPCMQQQQQQQQQVRCPEEEGSFIDHENKKTEHYSKLGSAFLQSTALLSSRRGKGGRGRSIM